jgi:hypothetical protein
LDRLAINLVQNYQLRHADKSSARDGKITSKTLCFLGAASRLKSRR